MVGRRQLSGLFISKAMRSSFHLARSSYTPPPLGGLIWPPAPQTGQSPQWGPRSGMGPWLCPSASPANAPWSLLSSWRQCRGTWVSIVIDVCGTSKGEAKGRACGKGAVQDLGGLRVKPLTLTQEHRYLALTGGTPIGGGHGNIWKEEQKGGGGYYPFSPERPEKLSRAPSLGRPQGAGRGM